MLLQPPPYDIGDEITVRHEVRDPDTGGLTDAATVVATLTAPDATTSSPAVTTDATGLYEATFTVDQAGTWQLKWADTDPTGVSWDVFDVAVDPATTSAWKPTAEEVHAVTPTRNGGDAWDVDSTPTLAEVESTITDAQAEVVGRLADIGGTRAVTGNDIVSVAKRAVTLLAAAYVELGGWPEQQTVSDQSIAPQLFARYEAVVEQLRTLIASSSSGATAGRRAYTVSTPTRVQVEYEVAVARGWTWP
jgi:hypothetical protein